MPATAILNDKVSAEDGHGVELRFVDTSSRCHSEQHHRVAPRFFKIRLVGSSMLRYSPKPPAPLMQAKPGGIFVDDSAKSTGRSEHASRLGDQRARDAEEERNELREENRQLKARCDCYEQAFRSSDMPGRDSDSRELLSEMTGLPKTPHEVAQLAVSVFCNEIDFSEQGWASLDECTTDPNVLWTTALGDIARILHPLLASDESVDVVAEFTSKSRFNYARSEGKQARKDPKLIARRKDAYQGREIFIERHISSSTGRPVKHELHQGVF